MTTLAGGRLEICGGIASGKTTLAGLLEALTNNVVYENFRENPFWKAFYNDPARYAFETEITFLLQHYVSFRDAHEEGGIIVCDTSLVLDAAYSDINLTASKHKIFHAVFNEVVAELPQMDILIHLKCSAEAELHRIRRRNRAEEAQIQVEYLAALNESVLQRVADVRDTVEVIDIDSEDLDFANNQSDQQKILELISTQYSERVGV